MLSQLPECDIFDYKPFWLLSVNFDFVFIYEIIYLCFLNVAIAILVLGLQMSIFCKVVGRN